MAIPLPDFCEQPNPKVLCESRKTQTFRDPKRIQHGFVTAAEKRALVWLAERTPAWISPDHLTLLGFGAQVMAGISYALATRNRLWLLGVIGFLALNWLGDSLDGTLARVRHRQRPRYGYYVDHVIDLAGTAALLSGMAASTLMTPSIALAVFAAYLLVSAETYLATHTVGIFRLSVGGIGPT